MHKDVGTEKLDIFKEMSLFMRVLGSTVIIIINHKCEQRVNKI